MNSHIRRSLLVLSILPFTIQCRAATAATPAATVTATGAFFGLSVVDLQASTSWYENKLGLTVTLQVPHSAEMRAAVTVLTGGGLTVELVQHDDASARS